MQKFIVLSSNEKYSRSNGSIVDASNYHGTILYFIGAVNHYFLNEQIFFCGIRQTKIISALKEKEHRDPLLCIANSAHEVAPGTEIWMVISDEVEEWNATPLSLTFSRAMITPLPSIFPLLSTSTSYFPPLLPLLFSFIIKWENGG